MKGLDLIMIKASVTFETEDLALKKLYDKAEQTEKNNITDFAGRKVLVEGGGYENIWLETQPMGGEMYAKRNPEVALNNQLFFLDYQREDGRIPGMIICENGKIIPFFSHYQGFYLAHHALNMYYLSDGGRDYLEYLYQGFERFDAHLWKTRDSDGNGCLETWCVCDTGEDNCSRFEDAPGFWSEDTPPTEFKRVPFESMDFMGFSYECRQTLSEISSLLKNGKTDFWAVKAAEVKAKMRSFLWREEKGAFYDRDKTNEFMDVLYQGNIKVMYNGCFEKDMADRFIDEHLLNPDEFWTPMPLPSIALNNAYYRGDEVNNWSGQPQSLTYQRSIRALENYGRYYELTEIARKYLKVVSENGSFTQQFDPFTGKSSKAWGNGDYGPCILSVLEFISRLYGVHLYRDMIYFGCFDSGHASNYKQSFRDREYSVEISGNRARGMIDNLEIFDVSLDTRVITDRNGNVLKIINTAPEQRTIRFGKSEKILSKNGVWSFDR